MIFAKAEAASSEGVNVTASPSRSSQQPDPRSPIPDPRPPIPDPRSPIPDPRSPIPDPRSPIPPPSRSPIPHPHLLIPQPPVPSSYFARAVDCGGGTLKNVAKEAKEAPRTFVGVSLAPDPVIEAYKNNIDRTLIR